MVDLHQWEYMCVFSEAVPSAVEESLGLKGSYNYRGVIPFPCS